MAVRLEGFITLQFKLVHNQNRDLISFYYRNLDLQRFGAIDSSEID